MGQISSKLKKEIIKFRSKRIIQIENLYKAKAMSIASMQSFKTINDLNDLEPVHAIYVSTQHLVSYLAELFSILPLFNEYYDKAIYVEDEYMPDGPPISPLTRSYFTCWAFFDLTFGKDKETMGTCIIDSGEELEISAEYIEIIKLMQKSRMGLYEHLGEKKGVFHLKELFTDKEYKCIVPSGYKGTKKELWFVRIFPAITKLGEENIVFNTPYVLPSSDKKEWMLYFDRTIKNMNDDIEPNTFTRHLKYEELMKYGLSTNYWSEYLFLAFYNSIKTAIFLRGIPDIYESFPQNEEE